MARASATAEPQHQTGPVKLVLLLDRRTSATVEVVTGQPLPPVPGWHPVLLDRLNLLEAEAAAHGPYDHGPHGTGRYPHPSQPGTHEELWAVNISLWNRDPAGTLLTGESLGDLLLQTVALLPSGQEPLPLCANCAVVLRAVTAGTGRYTAFPPDRGMYLPT